jgi:hypothetical protein
VTQDNCCAIADDDAAGGGWSKYILPMAQYGPLIATEFGTYDCSSPFYMRFLHWAANNNVSYTAFAVWPQNSGGPGNGACGCARGRFDPGRMRY